MRRCLTLFSTAIVPLAIFMACGGDGAGSDEGPSQVAEQCEQESCPACTGADALLMIGTSDHPQHTIDAKAAKAAADKNGYWFNDANDLTDTTEAGKALNALSHMPEGKIRTLVVAVHGHGIQGALAFNDGSTLSYPDLFAAIAKVGACKVYISNDSCYSGSMFEDMPDAGLGTCETVAASASGPDTGSSCTNGLSKVFTENLNAGTEPKAALEAAAASAGVQGNASPGMIETIVNPDCACGTTCIPRSALGKGADQLPGSGGSGGQSGAGGASGDSGVAGSAGSGGSGGIGTAGTGGTGTAGAAGSSGGGNGGSAGDAGASMCAAHADPCVDCVRTQCCSAVEACAADSSCKAALATWESCTMDAYSCAELFGVAGGSLASDVVSCSFQSCSAACYP